MLLTPWVLSLAPPLGLPPLLPAENKAFASNLPTLSVTKAAVSGPGKPPALQVRSLRATRDQRVS